MPNVFIGVRLLAATLLVACASPVFAQAPTPHHNVILFIADGLRRSSVTSEDMPTLYKLRTEGVDLRNSHAVFPTFTTANASAIATGHGLGDTGDFSNIIYPGLWLGEPNLPAATGSITPFLEADDTLATLNSYYGGNYLGEQTLLAAAHEHGFNVAAIGKVGPIGIQQIASIKRDQFGLMEIPDTLIIDDSTGRPGGIPLPLDFAAELEKSGLSLDTPLRSNGYADTSQCNNGFAGDAATPGTLAPDAVQQQWLADVTTKLVLPRFATEHKPFVLVFWSRDPDATQHNQGDSFQSLTPGINGPTSRLALHNADNSLKQLLDWLDAHPSIKASTDVLVTSDHGFATISRREIDAHGNQTGEPSAALTYSPSGKDQPEPPHTLPTGFLAVDLALWSHLRVFDPTHRATTGDSVYAEVPLSGETSSYPASGSALLGDRIEKLDGSDARLIIASNGGSDLIYVPGKDPKVVHETIATLTDLDYVGGIFADDAYCLTPTSCPGALPLSSIGLKGATHLPAPAIVVTYKHFYLTPGDIQTGIQVSDTNLQEGQGMHGGLDRDQTWNNMAAIGPDFKHHFVDPNPVGNIDLAPTIASILGFEMKSTGTLKGRVMTEALATAAAAPTAPHKTLVSAPSANGQRTILDYEEDNGVRYYDGACMTTNSTCPE